MTETSTGTESKENKAPKERSPSYPIISLQAALERLTRFEATFGRHPAPALKVGMAWGIKERSSQANQVLAALKAFGLVDYQGSGKDRKVVISESGRTYLRAQQESVREGVIRKAALKPKAIAKFWPTWGADRPPDAICLDTLVLENGFNENAAPTFLRVYDETIAFAGLNDSDKIPDKASDLDGDEEEDPAVKDDLPQVKVGDLIQWTSGGVDQFQTPGKVLGLSDDGQWVFTDQGESAVPLSEVTVMEAHTPKGAGTPPPPPPHVLAAMKAAHGSGAGDVPPAKGYRKATFPLDEGDVTILFPEGLSADGYEELDQYLQIFVKKSKKQANDKANADTSQSGE